MSIRYFATNRHRENLGQDIERNQRIQLQRGGYHWVDMQRYMSYYLATIDSKAMPNSVIVKNSQTDIFDQFLARPAVKNIVIGIHGFNMHLHASLSQFSMLADTLRYTRSLGPTIVDDPFEPTAKTRLDNDQENLTAIVGFSWPSDGSLFSYASDQKEAVSSTSALANLICRIRRSSPQAKVHVIAHSMGNLLVCHMLKALVYEEITPLNCSEAIQRQVARRDAMGARDFFLDRYIMLAPDVERRHVTQCNTDDSSNPKANYLGPFYAGLFHAVDQVHYFYSRLDTALVASNINKNIREVGVNVQELFTRKDNPDYRWEERLGLANVPQVAPPNLAAHNAVTLTNRPIDHGDYFDAKPIADMIEQIILG